MSGLSSEEIKHLAKLSRLSLTKQESRRINKDLGSILTFVEEISSLSIDELPRRLTVKLENLREDSEDSDRLTIEQLKKIAPKMDGRFVQVPAVFDDGSET